MVGAQARLAQARYAISRGVSQRRACALMDVSRSGLYYTLKMPTKDAPVIEVMQRLSGQYPRFGLVVSVSSWAAKAFRLARSAVHVYGGKQGSKCLRNVSGAVWRARCLDHACRLAGIASGATTLCTTPAPTVRHLNV